MNNKVLLWIFAIVLLLAVAWFWRPKEAKTPVVKVNNFEECTKAGYPVQESYPRGCRTPDGKVYFEVIKR